MYPIKLLVHCPNPNDATSWYRGVGPLVHLERTLREKSGQQLILQFTQKYSWETIAPCDVLFMQRPFKPEHKIIAMIAKDLGKPLWVDYDDDLFNVQTDNPTFNQYGKDSVQKAVAEVTAMADRVTVSTQNLANVLAPLNKNITVIQNALNERLLYYRDTENCFTNKLVLWRGSSTHAKDVATFSHDLIDVSNAHQDWSWTFLGYNPWFATDYMAKAVVAPPLDIGEYHKFIHLAKPALTIVPLHNNVFNLSKSNIAWLETIFAGGLALVPDWPEWRQPGTIRYKSPEDFRAKLDKFLTDMDDPEFRKECLLQNAEAWKHIQGTFTLKAVNPKRWDIIRELAFNYKPERLVDYETRTIEAAPGGDSEGPQAQKPAPGRPSLVRSSVEAPGAARIHEE